MLFIHLDGDREGAVSPRSVKWERGETLTVAEYEVNRVMYIQADDDELDWIAQGFGDTIPLHCNNRVQAWYGDVAKSIVYSLLK